MTELFDATPDYVRFRDSRLSTEYRYPRKIAGSTSIRLAEGPTWLASFTGSGSGTFYSWWHEWRDAAGTVSFTASSIFASVTVTGSGTAFSSSMIGQFMVTNGGRTTIKISSVASATSLSGTIVALTATGTYSGVAYRIGPILAEAGSSTSPYTPAHGPFESIEK